MYETWDIDMPSIPERSRLYHLKPIGVGTPYVESLTSYIIRLAEEHCVLPKALVKSEILPHLGQPSGSKVSTRYSYNALLTSAQSLNGMSSLAKGGVEALEKLTKCNNLCALTMLTWANVISKEGLLRETQAWCPLCYEEWQINRKIIYNPLLWSLKVVEVCLLHQQTLQERCPSSQCQKSPPMFATKIKLGYCPYCNSWLGGATCTNSIHTEPMTREEAEQAHWNAVALGELLEIVPHLSYPLQKEDLVLAVNRLIDGTPLKTTVSLSHLLQTSPRTIGGWQMQSRPQLVTLLQTCRFLGISPQHLFFEKSGDSILTISRGENAALYKNLKKPRNLHDPEKLRRSLEEVLDSEEEPSPSLQEVAQRLGYSDKSQIYRSFPEIAHAITRKHRKHQEHHASQTLSSDKLRLALEAVLASDEEPPPSTQEVAQRLGYQSTGFIYKRFPQLARAISLKKRNSEHLRQALETLLESADPPTTHQEVAKLLGCSINKLQKYFPELPNTLKKLRIQSFDIEGLQLALEKELLSDEEPRSLTEVARDLGHSVETLVRKFPLLCQKIVDRRKVYRKTHRELRKQKIVCEIQRVVFSLHAEQKYPSLHQTLKLVDRSCVSPPLFFVEAFVPWRKALEDLDYRK